MKRSINFKLIAGNVGLVFASVLFVSVPVISIQYNNQVESTTETAAVRKTRSKKRESRFTAVAQAVRTMR